MYQQRKSVPVAALLVSFSLMFARGSVLAAGAGSSTLPQAESPDNHFGPQAPVSRMVTRR